MKRKGTFVVRIFNNEIVAVATGDFSDKFKGMVKLNETGLVLWKLLLNDVTIDQMAKALTEEYDISEDVAKEDVQSFVVHLCDAGLIEDEDQA